MSTRNLGSFAVAGDGLVKTADLSDKERLRLKLEALLASAATTDIHRDLLVQSIWAWKVDRRSRVISHDYGIPINFAELQKMVSEKRLKSRKDVEQSEAGYLKYLTRGEFILEDKNWTLYRNPSSKEEGKTTKSSEFFEKTSSRKKSDAEYFREAARVARNIMLSCLSTNEDAIQIIRNGVELGSFNSLENFLDRVAKDDGTTADDGSRTILRTVQSFKRLARMNTNKLELSEIAIAYYDEFVANMTSKTDAEGDQVTAENLYGEEITGKTEEPESFMLSRIAVAMALTTVDEEILKQVEHEFRAKTSLNSTPTAFRDNIDVFMQIVKREINKAPKQLKVRAINEESHQALESVEEEKVAKVQRGESSSWRGRGRGRGGGRGGYSGGRPQHDRKADDKPAADESSKKDRTPCPYCWQMWRKLNYGHKPEHCRSRKKAEESMAKEVKEVKQVAKQEIVKTIQNDRYYENYQNDDMLEGGQLGISS